MKSGKSTRNKHEDLTGFTHSEILLFSHDIGVSERDLTIALVMIHSNLKAVVAHYLIRSSFGWDLSPPACNKVLRDVARAVSATVPMNYKPESRFDEVKSLFKLFKRSSLKIQ